MAYKIWEAIFTHLKDKGFDVFSPGTKKGDCKEAYIVLIEGATSKHASYSSTTTNFDILCYVPEDMYSTLTPYVESVVESLKDVKQIRPTYFRTTPFHDEEKSAWMQSIQYLNYRKI